jgi:hypothetical protein
VGKFGKPSRVSLLGFSHLKHEETVAKRDLLEAPFESTTIDFIQSHKLFCQFSKKKLPLFTMAWMEEQRQQKLIEFNEYGSINTHTGFARLAMTNVSHLKILMYSDKDAKKEVKKAAKKAMIKADKMRKKLEADEDVEDESIKNEKVMDFSGF